MGSSGKRWTRWATAGLIALGVGCGDEDVSRRPWATGADDGAGGAATEGGGGDLDEDTDGAGSLTNADDDHGGDDGADTGRPPAGDDDGEPPGMDTDGAEPPPPGADCPANCYCEPYDPDANVDDLVAGYSAANWESTVLEFLGRRWPAGRDLLEDSLNDPYFGVFSDKSSFDAAFGDGLPTEAHEMTHGWDFGHATVSEFAYFVRDDLQYFPPKIDGFQRAEIYGMVETSASDLYADLYLTGQQGTYGWMDVLDEGNCYMHDLAVYGVVGEFVPWAGVSGRDGAVAFMYYLELYLKRARTQYPDLYAQLQAEPDYVDFVLTQWLRMHFFLPFVDAHPELGINDAAIREVMYAPENMAEIEMFVGHELEASNCLPQ